MMAKQAGVQFRLHPAISPSIPFSGTVRGTPLRQVLDTMTRAGKLRWEVQRDGSVLISPLPPPEKPVRADPSPEEQ